MTQKSTAPLRGILCLTALAVFLASAGCAPVNQPPTATHQPSPTPIPATVTPSSTSAPTHTLTLPLPTSTITSTPIPPTLTRTATRAITTRPPSVTPRPTSAWINQSVKRRMEIPAFALTFSEGSLWIVNNSNIDRVDPANGKLIQTTKTGCEVCFGACEAFSAAPDGQFFWMLHYGGIGENKCSSNDPWANVGYALRKIRPGSTAIEWINITSILSRADFPEISRIAVKENKVFLAVGETIYVIDAARSKADQPEVIKTILPGITVKGLLYANDTLWAAGEALLAINPNTYAVGAIYPLAADLLAFDGKRMWGVIQDEMTLQSVDLATRALGDPIALPEDFYLPTAIGSDGKAIWLSFLNDTRLLTIPFAP